MSKIKLGYKFAPIPEWVLYHPELSALAVRVYGVLARRGMTPDDCFPSHATIAAKAGIAERSVARPLADLERVGAVIAIHRGSKSGGRTSDGYWLAGDAPFTAQDSAETLGGYRADDEGVTAQDSAERTARDSAPKENQGNERYEGESARTQVPLFANDATNGKGPTRGDPLEGFAEWYAIYPRKVARGAAEKAWPAALRRAGSIRALVDGALRYRDKPGRTAKFTAHPATWLNEVRWEDAPEGSEPERPPQPNPDAVWSDYSNAWVS